MRSAIAFLTPFGRAAGSSVPTALSLSWFPVVGAAQGLMLGLTWWALDDVLSTMALAGLVVVGDLAITGMLHFDGLADSADGLLGPLERQHRLEVMKTPEVGAFGIAAISVILMTRFGAIASLDASPLLLSALWCASRTAMACAIRQMTYARPSGLASAFTGDGAPGWMIGLSGLLASLLMALIGATTIDPSSGMGTPTASALGVIGVGLGAGAVLWLAQRRIGGFTGDVLGAAGVVGETLGLVLATARW